MATICSNFGFGMFEKTGVVDVFDAVVKAVFDNNRPKIMYVILVIYIYNLDNFIPVI